MTTVRSVDRGMGEGSWLDMDGRASVGGGVREVSPVEVRHGVAVGEAVLIDVREPDEHGYERIAGAVLVPLSTFDAARVASLAKPGQTIVMHCKGGKRSMEACRLASSLSERETSVVSMAGGIEGWKNAGLPVVKSGQGPRISVMRQVQLVVGSAVLAGSALAWLVHPGFVAIPAFFGSGLAFAGATGTCALASVLSAMPWNKSGGGSVACAMPGRSFEQRARL